MHGKSLSVPPLWNLSLFLTSTIVHAANSVGFIDPGFIHSVVMSHKLLVPGKRYYYRYGSEVRDGDFLCVRMCLCVLGSCVLRSVCVCVCLCVIVRGVYITTLSPLNNILTNSVNCKPFERLSQNIQHHVLCCTLEFSCCTIETNTGSFFLVHTSHKLTSQSHT